MSDVDVRAMARNYEVRILPTEDGDYEVFVPELEAIGCRVLTGGHSQEEALANALEAIECVIEGRLAEGKPLPVRAAA